MRSFVLTAAAAAVLLPSGALAEGPAMPPPMKRGDAHEVLGFCVGEWDVESKFWPAPGDPIVSKGKSSCRWVVDRLAIAYDYDSTGKSPFHGHGLTVWNQDRKVYEAWWFDTMSYAGPTRSTGSWDEKTKTFTETMTTPMPGGGEDVMSSSTVVRSKDEYVVTMSRVGDDGKDVVVMELTYKRAKGKKGKP